MVRIIAAAVCLRAALVTSGLGHYLATRIEVSTPAIGPMPIREGIALLGYGISPYAGSTCHSPPLVLYLFGAGSHQPTHATGMCLARYPVLQAAADVAGALLVRSMLLHGAAGVPWPSDHCSRRHAMHSCTQAGR